MIEMVKTALRVKSAVFDAEIAGIIAACKADLSIAGVVKTDDADPLIVRAVILYAKANFGFSEDGERYQKAYDYLKCSLALAGDYNGVV